eukprot:c46604_g1_i1 orf=35-196(-)
MDSHVLLCLEQVLVFFSSLNFERSSAVHLCLVICVVLEVLHKASFCNCTCLWS